MVLAMLIGGCDETEGGTTTVTTAPQFEVAEVVVRCDGDLSEPMTIPTTTPVLYQLIAYGTDGYGVTFASDRTNSYTPGLGEDIEIHCDGGTSTWVLTWITLAEG